MADTEVLEQANTETQRRFRAMVEAGVYGDPNHPLTLAYVRAERQQDSVIKNAQWEAAKSAMDALQSADHDFHVLANVSVHACDDCLGYAEPGYSFTYQTEADLHADLSGAGR